MPSFGISQIISGSILKATTICKSALSAFNSEIKFESFKLVGCSIFICCLIANSFMADCFIFCPRPAGLSGAVITATTLNPLFINISKLETANSGVPIKTIRIFFIIIKKPLQF